MLSSRTRNSCEKARIGKLDERWGDLNACSEVDPYAFDDDFDKDVATLNSSSGGDFGRVGPVSAAGSLGGGKSNLVTNYSAASPAGSTGSSAYKFKSALLSREQVSSTPSPEPPTFQVWRLAQFFFILSLLNFTILNQTLRYSN